MAMLRTLLGIGLNNAIPLYLEIEASQIINTLKETTHRLFHHFHRLFPVVGSHHDVSEQNSQTKCELVSTNSSVLMQRVTQSLL